MMGDRVVRDNPTWITAGNRLTDTAFPTFQYEMRISLPFCGIDGASRACKEAQWHHSPRNCYDNRDAVHGALRRLHPTALEHIKNEDITNVKMEDLSTSEGYVGTAPCQDFSKLGIGAGLGGRNGCLYMLQFLQIKAIANRPGNPLKWIVLENVLGVKVTRRDDVRSPFDVVEEWWEVNMPGWTPLQPWEVQLRDASSAGSRGRCIVVAFSRDWLEACGGDAPQPPPKHPHVAMEDFLLDHDSPILQNNKKIKNLSKKMLDNVRAWSNLHDARMKDASPKELGCLDVSRPVDGIFKAYISEGFFPLLSTKNSNLCILRPSGMVSSKVGNPKKRLLSIEERALIMGVEHTSIAPTQSERQALISYGNMFPVNLAGVVLRQIMEKWAVYEHRLMSMGLLGDTRLFDVQAGACDALCGMLQVGGVGEPAKKKSKKSKSPSTTKRKPTPRSGSSKKLKNLKTID